MVSNPYQHFYNSGFLHDRRLLVSLTLALCLHVLFIAIPLQQQQRQLAKDKSLHVALTRSPATGSKETTQRETGTEQDRKTTPTTAVTAPDGNTRKPTIPEAPTDSPEPRSETPPAPARKGTATQKPVSRAVSEPVTEAPSKQPPTANNHQGAKTRSTIFDPRLLRQLEQERNKVQKFKKLEAEFMTATGTFIQNGDYCAEIRKVLVGDADSNLYQPFTIKCTKWRRPQEDIDRQAEKYGIP
ncbi:hypothetical protein [Microbulbifer sediminum]|uniref:hypothetical protein n=1 Tax=Microbulbifer sediminum TaxID=2904250 RepID=UPI001F2B09BB|nr:hypothetical protein [Microbulbifer sediminum]